MKKQLMFLSIATIIGLSGCGNNASQENHANSNKESKHEEMNHEGMNHSSSGEVPKGLKEAKNPTYQVGDEAIMHTDHMEGMNGAKATIVGAYDTTAYAISYTPTTGGKRVTNHKWVIHEEIKNAGDKPFKPETEVTIMADHMKGMNGATAKIDSTEQTTVYMVDYTPTTGGEKVTNHKWVTESELSTK
ncbi:YdhK family protein [Peribacillus loiseleuriae]|uniref:YdhK family protein n=1 Tax=Peribacillus loiseleuriae TaxID=1679170 RepID=UPI003CFBF52D